MSVSQIEIQIIGNALEENHVWKQLLTFFAVPGQRFEIHCWKEEKEEIKEALQLGKEKAMDWEWGTVVEGIVDDNFLHMIQSTEKPLDRKIYNKMTPFFSIFLENGFFSEHYGTEIHITAAPVEDSRFQALLEQISKYADIREW